MLTERDRDILEVLTNRVRFLSLPQLARTWWGEARNATATARRRLLHLQAAGLLRLFSLSVHPELFLTTPLCRWSPGEPTPDFKPLAYRAQARWTEPPAVLLAASASPRAAGTFGIFTPRVSKRNDQTHDLHLATVYLWKRAAEPEQARQWRSEEAIRAGYDGYDDKLPDAWVDGPRPLVVDFVGRYKETRLRDIHRYCQRRGVQYELW